jgi:hypothetical protein
MIIYLAAIAGKLDETKVFLINVYIKLLITDWD